MWPETIESSTFGVLRTISLLYISYMVSITAFLLLASYQTYLDPLTDRKLYFMLHFERPRAQKLKQICQDLSTLAKKGRGWGVIQTDHHHLSPKGIYRIFN